MIDASSDYETAKLTGNKFFLGRSCVAGHSGVRYTSSPGVCVECHKLRKAQGRRPPPEVQRMYERRYAARHGDRVKEMSRTWQHNNRDRIREANRTWKQANWDKVLQSSRDNKRRRRDAGCPSLLIEGRLSSSRRRARKRTGYVTVPISFVRMIQVLQGDACAYCGSTENLELDHKIALARGGTHVHFNLQWLCRFHNRHKKTTPDATYRRRHGIPAVTAWDWAPKFLSVFL